MLSFLVEDFKGLKHYSLDKIVKKILHLMRYSVETLGSVVSFGLLKKVLPKIGPVVKMKRYIFLCT